MTKITYVNLADLNLPEFQAHRDINPDHIKEISESIKSIGVIEPLIIRDTKNGLEIVAGCVRFESARHAGLKAVPCIKMDLDPKAAEVLKLHENIKRVDLDHVDQGHTFQMMIETFGMTEQQVADSIGRSIGYVSQHISLILFENDLSRAVKEKRISFSQARELMRIDDPLERSRLMNYCEQDGASVQVLKRWVQDHLRNSSPTPVQNDSTPEQTYNYNNPDISRKCEACDKSVEINLIRQVFYCPDCHHSIKQAINEEKQKNTSKSP
ncbi:Nucleoid occlusion protein [subsurface metagenome]